jgi:radical SAM protein with 4Fe4S-binding SPASM domain
MFAYKTLKSPAMLQVEITEDCNNDCLHCYNHWREEDAPAYRKMDLAKIQRVCDQVVEKEVFSVTFTGGEPLTNFKVLLHGIDTLASQGVDCRLNSNLVAANRSRVDGLKEAGVKSILTSLLSHNEGIHNEIVGKPNAYKFTMKGIEAVMEADIPLSVNMVVMKKNLQDVYETGKFVASLGVKAFCATKVSSALNCRDFAENLISREEVVEVLDTLLRLQEEFGLQVDTLESYPLCALGDIQRYEHFARRSCSAGNFGCTIGADGHVRPCSHADMVYGNIYEEDLDSIWLKMADWRCGNYIPTTCKDCSHLHRCSGGCRTSAKYLDSIDSMDPIATCPSDVHTLPPAKKPILADVESQYVSSSGFMRRTEEFGGCIFTSRSGATLVNKESYELISKIDWKKPFRLVDLENHAPHHELATFLGGLLQRGAIKSLPLEGR